MTRMRVMCTGEGGPVLVDSAVVLIDDESESYRFLCPACHATNERVMTDLIRGLLRQANVATVDELTESFASLLDSDANIWRAMLT